MNDFFICRFLLCPHPNENWLIIRMLHSFFLCVCENTFSSPLFCFDLSFIRFSLINIYSWMFGVFFLLQVISIAMYFVTLGDLNTILMRTTVTRVLEFANKGNHKNVHRIFVKEWFDVLAWVFIKDTNSAKKIFSTNESSILSFISFVSTANYYC